MEQKIQLLTKQAPPPAGPYSQGIETEQFVFVSGQRPVDPVTGEMKNGIKSQTEQVIKNVECVLKEAGCTLADIVRSTVYLSDISYFDERGVSCHDIGTVPCQIYIWCSAQGDISGD